MRARLQQRPTGSVLLMVLVVMAILALLAVAAIHFTGGERDAALHTSRAGELRACAETARAHLLARLRANGVDSSPENIVFVDPLLDDETAGRRTVARTGHYGATNPVTPAQGVHVVSAGMGSMSDQARDLTNVIAATPFLSNYYRVVVSCDSRGRQTEMEFVIQYTGLGT